MVGEGGAALLMIVKVGDADYPVSVMFTTDDGSAEGICCRNPKWDGLFFAEDSNSISRSFNSIVS